MIDFLAFFEIMQDWAGWLLMLFSFSIVLMWRHVRSDTKVVHAIWLCMLLHHAVAFLNAYGGGVIGTETEAINDIVGDARTYHFYGSQAALSEPEDGFWNNPRVAYTNSLGFFYRAFGVTFFLGDELSVLAFALSCVVLVKLVDLLDLRRFRVGIILLFGLLPSAVIFRSVTLRESWQALFFLLSIYWALRLRKQLGILTVSFLIMAASCMALLHKGLKAYALYLIGISIFWVVSNNKKGICGRLARFMFAGVLVACVIVLIQKVGVLGPPLSTETKILHPVERKWYLTVDQALEAVADHRISAASITVDNRALYGVMLDTSSVLGLVKSTFIIFVQYMFAPFPWQVENVKDIYAMLESILRFVLLFFAFSSWRRSSGEVRSCYGFLLISVLSMEFLWALGTINWGTAIRHHVPGYSVLVLLGGPGLILFMRKIHIGLFGRGKVNTMLLK
jgi:hypothetical protein